MRQEKINSRVIHIELMRVICVDCRRVICMIYGRVIYGGAMCGREICKDHGRFMSTVRE